MSKVTDDPEKHNIWGHASSSSWGEGSGRSCVRNQSVTGEYDFKVSHTRHDYKNETWMTGSVGLMCGWGPFQLLGTMHLPLAYLLEKNTELVHNGRTLVDLTQRNVWAVQEPVSFRLLLVVGLER